MKILATSLLSLNLLVLLANLIFAIATKNWALVVMFCVLLVPSSFVLLLRIEDQIPCPKFRRRRR